MVQRASRTRRSSAAVLFGEVLGAGEDFGGVAAAEFAVGSLAGLEFGEFEVFEESGEIGAGDLGGIDERTRGIGDAVDAAVDVVAQRIARGVLHVADEHVVPVDDVEGAVGRELEVDGAEVSVGGLIRSWRLRLDGGAVVDGVVLLDAEEADRVAGEEVALDFIGEVARGDELGAGGRGGRGVRS